MTPTHRESQLSYGQRSRLGVGWLAPILMHNAIDATNAAGHDHAVEVFVQARDFLGIEVLQRRPARAEPHSVELGTARELPLATPVGSSQLRTCARAQYRRSMRYRGLCRPGRD